jgi:protein-S-isoprenylcysteine O-methyltransferase Ste14
MNTAIYCIIIASYCWSNIFFFKTKGQEAIRSRKIYSLLVTPVILMYFICLALNSNSGSSFLNLLALGILFISLFIFWSAIFSNKIHKLNYAFCPPNALNFKGPYRFVRHPLYVSYVLTWVGATIASGIYSTLLFILPLMIYYYKAAKKEEASFLNGTLRDPYQAYCNSVGMFLPKFSKLL